MPPAKSFDDICFYNYLFFYYKDQDFLRLRVRYVNWNTAFLYFYLVLKLSVLHSPLSVLNSPLLPPPTRLLKTCRTN